MTLFSSYGREINFILEKVVDLGHSGSIESVFGRTGTILALLNDYDASLINNDSSVAGATVKDALEALSLTTAPVDSVYGRTGVITALLNDYVASLIGNDSTVVGSTVKDALESLLIQIPSVPVDSVFGRTGVITALLNDYAASLVDNDSTVTGATVKDALETLLSQIPSVPVDSVYGRTGAVTALLNDYAASLVNNDSTVTGTTVKDALETLLALISGAGAVDSVFGRTGIVTALLNDYDASLVNNDSGVAGATVKDALDSLASLIPSVPVDSVFGRTGTVIPALNDYAASLIDNDSIVAGITVKDALETVFGLIPSVPIDSVFGRTGVITALLNDYTASLIDNDSAVTGATVKDALDKLDNDIGNIPTAPITSVFGRAGIIIATLGDYVSSLVLNDSTISGTTVKDSLDFIKYYTDNGIIGPGSAIDGNILLADGITGKLAKDSLKSIVTTLGSDDTTVPTSKAVADAGKLQSKVARLLAASIAAAEAETYESKEICVVPNTFPGNLDLIYQYDPISTAIVDHVKVLDVANPSGRLILVNNYATQIALEDAADFYSTADVECGMQESGEHTFDLTDDTAFHRFNVSETIVAGVWTVTITQPDGLNLEFNLNRTRAEHTSDTMSINCTLHAGTDVLPKSVYVYVIDDGAGNPLLTCSNTSPLSAGLHHVDAAIYKAGAVSATTRTEYGAFAEEVSAYEFLSNVFHRFLSEGTVYLSGLNFISSQTDVTIGVGSTKLVFKTNTTDQKAVIADGLFHILDDGTFVNINDFSFTEYSSGETITTNKYYNVILGVVSNGTTKICAIVQNKGIVEYVSTTNAESDLYNTLLLKPSDSLINSFFVPVCRVVVQKTANNYLQVLSSGSYALDMRGQTSTGGGAAVSGSNVLDGNNENDVPFWNTSTGQYEPKFLYESRREIDLYTSVASVVLGDTYSSLAFGTKVFTPAYDTNLSIITYKFKFHFATTDGAAAAMINVVVKLNGIVVRKESFDTRWDDSASACYETLSWGLTAKTFTVEARRYSATYPSKVYATYRTDGAILTTLVDGYTETVETKI